MCNCHRAEIIERREGLPPTPADNDSTHCVNVAAIRYLANNAKRRAIVRAEKRQAIIAGTLVGLFCACGFAYFVFSLLGAA